MLGGMRSHAWIGRFGAVALCASACSPRPPANVDELPFEQEMGAAATPAPRADHAAPATVHPDDPAPGLYAMDREPVIAQLRAMTEAAGEAAESADQELALLARSRAWLFVDDRDPPLVIHRIDRLQAQPLDLTRRQRFFELTPSDAPDRMQARCIAESRTELSCKVTFAHIDGAPLKVRLHRASAAQPGLPAPGIYDAEPPPPDERRRGEADVAAWLSSLDVEPERARLLAKAMMDEAAVFLVDGSTGIMLGASLSHAAGEVPQLLRRQAVGIWGLRATRDGFEMELMWPPESSHPRFPCEAVNDGFRCRDQDGTRQIYVRRST
jgi:hypothetical protein